MSPRERRAGPSLHMGIHQGQELVCEVVLSDAATQFEERFALATNYRDYVGRNSPRANIEMRRYEEFLKSPLHVKEDYVLYPAECCEQRYKDELDEMLVTSPLHEDKTQVEEFYKDVRFPSSLQSRPPSVTSSTGTERSCRACALAVRSSTFLCADIDNSGTGQMISSPLQSEDLDRPGPAAERSREVELQCGPRDSRHHHPAAEDKWSKARGI